VPDSEIVLTKDGNAVSELRERGDQAAAALRGHLIQEEVREIESGEGAVVLEVTEDPFVAGVGEALSLVEPASAELELMAPLEPRVLLTHLIAFNVIEFRAASIAEPEVADVEGAQSIDRLISRNADAPVGLADSCPVHRNRLELH